MMNKSHLRLVYNQAKDELTLDIEGVIGVSNDWWTGQAGTTKEQVAEKLKEIANSKASRITVNINSYGGDVNHGISIHDLLAEHKAKVTTIIHGHTASAATIISQAGDERKMSDNALFLVHKASTVAMGNTHDLETSLSDLVKCDQSISNIYAKRTGKSQDEMLGVMDRNNGQGEWLTANEAKDLGFIDEVYEPMKAVALVKPGTFSAMGLPEIPENKLKLIDMKADKTTVKEWLKNFVKNAFSLDVDEDGNPVTEPITAPPADPPPAEPPAEDPPTETEPAADPEPTAKKEIVLKDLKEIQDALADLAGQNESKEAEILDLKAKFQAVSDELAKLKAGPTNTWPKDDPITDSGNIKTNELADEQNAAALRGDNS